MSGPLQMVSTAESSARTSVEEEFHAWLARFAPLLEEIPMLDAAGCRRRLDAVESLRRDASALEELLAVTPGVEPALVQTFRAAAGELDHLEDRLRRRLGRLAPGDPGGRVDLAELNARLAETAAHRELAEATGSSGELDRLEICTSRRNWGAAAVLGLFSLGWNGFTTFHAAMMIGGMYSAFGPLALFLLLFYALFWAAGLAMAWGAFRLLAEERLELDGRNLTLRRRYPFRESRTAFELGENSTASLVDASVKRSDQDTREVLLTDGEGREIRLAAGRPRAEQERLVARLNAYLEGLPR